MNTLKHVADKDRHKETEEKSITTYTKRKGEKSNLVHYLQIDSPRIYRQNNKMCQVRDKEENYLPGHSSA